MRQLQKPSSRLSRLIPRTKRQKLVLLGVGVIIVGIVAGLIIRSALSPDHRVKRKLVKLDKTNVPCAEIRSELGNTTDYSKYSVDTQKRVLEKQMLCFSDNFQYDKAIPAAQKLEALYAAEHDEAHRAQIATTIQMMQTTQAQLKAVNDSSNNAKTQ